MPSERTPGPVCQISNPRVMAEGPLCRSPSTPPGLLRQPSQDLRALDVALDALKATALNFASRFIQDARARASYVGRIATAAADIRADVLAGRVSAAAGAAFAVETRNLIMEETRAITSAIGRASAQSLKSQGLSLEAALAKAVHKLYPGQSFGELGAQQKRRVFEEVIEASGRSSPKVTAQIPRWTRLGRGLVVVTAAISVYNIWAAENRIQQGIKEGATLLGGAAGSAAAAAGAGFVCGPGAPVCVTALLVIGGIAGALTAGAVSDTVLNQRDIIQWFGG